MGRTFDTPTNRSSAMLWMLRYPNITKVGILEEESKNHHYGGFVYKSGREDFESPRGDLTPLQPRQGPTSGSQRRDQKTTDTVVLIYKSGREDLNLRPLAPHASALAGLRHAPICERNYKPQG